jgi:hypothetical protein
LARWHIMRSYNSESVDTCNTDMRNVGAWGTKHEDSGAPKIGQGMSPPQAKKVVNALVAESFSDVQCVSTDDPRLAK